jgi:hypothetical protein
MPALTEGGDTGNVTAYDVAGSESSDDVKPSFYMCPGLRWQDGMPQESDDEYVGGKYKAPTLDDEPEEAGTDEGLFGPPEEEPVEYDPAGGRKRRRTG